MAKKKGRAKKKKSLKEEVQALEEKEEKKANLVDEKRQEMYEKEARESKGKALPKQAETKKLGEKGDSYTWNSNGVPVKVVITRKEKEFVPVYELQLPRTGEGTRALLKNIKENVIASYEFGDAEMLDVMKMRKLKASFKKK